MKATAAAVVIRTVVVTVVEAAAATSMDILEVVMEVAADTAAALEAIACRTLVQVFRSKTGVSYREGQQHIWHKLTHMI